MTKRNRDAIMDKRNAKRRDRSDKGTGDIIKDRNAHTQKYNLDWFAPTEKQKDIIYSMCVNDLTVVQGSSGVGKTTTAICQALRDLQQGRYKHLVMIKTPSESGDDPIGFIPGDSTSKLEPHFNTMRIVFSDFMSKEKLAMEEKRGNIQLSIPNHLQGATLYDSIIILDESQSMSTNTVKLLLERVGEGSRVVMLGDKNQRYSIKKRNDGFTDFVNRVTDINEFRERVSVKTPVGYVELTSRDNMRSNLSRFIVELYEDEA